MKKFLATVVFSASIAAAGGLISSVPYHVQAGGAGGTGWECSECNDNNYEDKGTCRPGCGGLFCDWKWRSEETQKKFCKACGWKFRSGANNVCVTGRR